MTVTALPVQLSLPKHCDARRLEAVFKDCFSARFNTRLEGGADEPLYLPAAVPGRANVIYYRADYFASALHEVAHWCIAGAARRRQQDFGYWYAADGRSARQQKAFEAVEYKPQALEWFFASACGSRFKLSVDNLNTESGEIPDTGEFRQRIWQQALLWRHEGLPERAAVFYQALCGEFGTCIGADTLPFELAELQ